METSKRQAANSLKWSAIERFLAQGMQFCLTLIIARFVAPEQFGLIGMLTVFIAVAQTFADSGFASALIRKGKPTDLEYSTAFYFNVVIGVVGYGLIVCIAPFISEFYDQPILSDLIKVAALNILVNSLAIVPRARLIVSLNFKLQAKISLASVIVSGCVGVSLAYLGYGAWSLAWQTVTMTAMSTMLMWALGRWLPRSGFDYNVFKDLFDFGYKLLASSLLDTIYKNLSSLVIGKQFSAVQLGLYTQSYNLSELAASNMTLIMQRVNFPLMSRVKDNHDELLSVFKNAITNSCYVIFPVMGGMAVLAFPIIDILLGEKWLGVAPLLQVLCISAMLYPWHAIHLNLLQVKGRSDLFLKLEIIKKVNFTIMLIVTSQISVFAMCIGTAITSLISVYINSYYTEQFLKISFFEQLKMILPALICTFFASSGAMSILQYFELSSFSGLSLGITVGLILYIMTSMIISPALPKLVYDTVVKNK